MPIVKAISGHTSCQKVKKYLEKKNRALARDFFNLSWDEREMAEYNEAMKDAVEWADEMDFTRAQLGNDQPYEGRKARTYKHFIISPDPEDNITLDSLRELASAWALRFFDDYQIAIVYHDDNTNNIPHAHLVVNCSNLVTGNRLHTDNPLELNRELQRMAEERGLRGLSNEDQRKVAKELLGTDKEIEAPRSIQGVHMSRAEAELISSNQYSWVADIRNRVAIAKELARNESEFRQLLKTMDIEIQNNSTRATRRDWIFSLAEDPKCKVTGGRLGFAYCKDTLQNHFENKAAYHLDNHSSREALKAAKNAVVINDLQELDRMASALETCSKYGIKSQAECLTYIRAMEGRIEGSHIAAHTQKALDSLKAAYEYVSEKNLLPKYSEPAEHHRSEQVPASKDTKRKGQHQQTRQREASRDSRDRDAR